MKQNNNNEADFYIYWHRKTHWLKKKTLEIIEHVQNDPTFSKKKKNCTTLKMSVCVPLCLYINIEQHNCNLQKLEHGLRTGHGTTDWFQLRKP